MAARGGRATVSLANVLGSNIFDLLVAVPVGVLVAGSLPITFSAVQFVLEFLDRDGADAGRDGQRPLASSRVGQLE